MNRLQILSAIERRAYKMADKLKNPDIGITHEKMYEIFLNSEFAALERACALNERLDEVLKKYKIDKSSDKLNDYWYWITIRPPEHKNNEFAEFMYVCGEYIQRKMFIGGSYCYEQKGETIETLGYGYHLHVLGKVRNGLEKTQMIKDTKSTFSKWIKPHDVPEAMIEIVRVKTEEDLNRIEMYMSGTKCDDWKDKSSALDPDFRKKWNLESIYQVRDAS